MSNKLPIRSLRSNHILRCHHSPFLSGLFGSLACLALATLILPQSSAMAQEKEKDQIVPKIVTSNLKNPFGVAVRPITGEILVADTGRGRIIQIEREITKEVVVDFPIKEFELDKAMVLGPTSLLFRGRHILFVGSVGGEDGEDSISMFDLEQQGRKAFKPEDAVKSLSIEASDDGPAAGNFFAMTRNRTGLYISGYGKNDPSWITSADLIVNDFENFRRLINTPKLTGHPNPGGIALSPENHLVVAQIGSRDEPGDSKLAFYSPAGELLDIFPTGLNDIVSLAYGPKSKRLYALDFSWENPKKGGLYKLVAVDSKDGCEAELIAKLERPTSMTFDQSGNLYITVCGMIGDSRSDSITLVDEEFTAPGKLLLIPGLE